MSRGLAGVVVVSVLGLGLGCGGGGDSQPVPTADPIVGTWRLHAQSDTMESAWYSVPENVSASLTFGRGGGFAAVIRATGASAFSWAASGQWQQVTAGEYLVVYSGEYSGERETYYLVAGHVGVLLYDGYDIWWGWFRRA